MHNSEQNKWYVIYVSSRQEKVVSKRINELNIETYLPIIKQVKQWSDRKKTLEVVLFNGYLFIKTNPVFFEKILSVIGVVCFLKIAKEYAIVRDIEIETIKSMIAKGYDINSVADFVPEIDKNVIVNQGPLKGWSGIIEKINSQNYLTIFFDSFGQHIRVKIEKEFLIEEK